MPLPIAGIWELIADEERALWIFTENHIGAIIERVDRKRGFIASSALTGNRVQGTLLVGSAPSIPPKGDFTFEVQDNVLTWQHRLGGSVTPAGYIEKFRKVNDLTMTSPFSGVWQLISETDTAFSMLTDTHWLTVVNRGDFRRGFSGTYAVEGHRVHNTILFDTAVNAPTHMDLEFHREGDVLTAKRVTEGTMARIPAGYTDQWRKIG